MHEANSPITPEQLGGTPSLDLDPQRTVSKELADALIFAKKQGRYMVSLWTIVPRAEGPSELRMNVFRVEFPVEDFNESLRMLQENLAQSVTGGIVPAQG